MSYAITSRFVGHGFVAFLGLVLLLGTARVCAQPPMPVAPQVEDAPLTTHICPPRLPVIFLSWNQTGQVARSWRIYNATNPLTPLSNYTFFAEVTTTQVPVMAQKPMEFFCVSAVRAYDGKESERVGMR